MPMLNREVHEYIEAELAALNYPKLLYFWSGRKDQLRLMAGDRIYHWKVKGAGIHSVNSLVDAIKNANAYRLKVKASKQIDIEDAIRAAS